MKSFLSSHNISTIYCAEFLSFNIAKVHFFRSTVQPNPLFYSLALINKPKTHMIEAIVPKSHPLYATAAVAFLMLPPLAMIHFINSYNRIFSLTSKFFIKLLECSVVGVETE